MSKLQAAKTVVSLPEQLTANTIYFIRVGQGFDLCCTDALGQVAYKINALTQDDLDNVLSELLSTLGTAATANVTTSSTDATAGRLLKVGDFGAGSGIFVTNAEDLNNILDPGNYAFDGSTANSPAPGTGDGIMAVFGRRDVDVMQLANQSTSTPLYFRKNDAAPTTSEGWSPWIPLANLNSPAFTGNPSVPNLKFGNVASADVNTLDYYEEGMWTPTVEPATTPGAIVYANRAGSYTKIGDLVFWSAVIALAALGGATGGFRIGGFPFIVRAGVAYSGGVSVGYFSSLSTTGIVNVFGMHGVSTSTVVLHKIHATGGETAAALLMSDVSDNFQIRLSGVYKAA